MSDDRDVQDWFNRSVDTLPSQPFAWEVAAKVRRRELKLRLQRYAAWLMTGFSVVLLLPRLSALLSQLAALPLTVANAGGEQWPLIVLVTLGLACWLARRARNAGLP